MLNPEGDRMRRLCVCGRYIGWKQSLCKTCLSKYGRKSIAWPDWLDRWVSSMQKEIDHDRRHDDLELYDESAGVDAMDGDGDAMVESTSSSQNGLYTPRSGDQVETELIMKENYHEIMNLLTEEQKTVLALKDSGLRQREIAKKLGISQQAVSRRLNRARAVAAKIMGLSSRSSLAIGGKKQSQVKRLTMSEIYVDELLRHAPYKDEALNRMYRQALRGS